MKETTELEETEKSFVKGLKDGWHGYIMGSKSSSCTQRLFSGTDDCGKENYEVVLVVVEERIKEDFLSCRQSGNNSHTVFNITSHLIIESQSDLAP